MVTNLEICFAGCKRSINDNTDEYTGGRAQESEDHGAAQKGPGYEVEFREISCKFERENGVNMSSGVYVFPAY